jgi:hypothetical protein
MRNTNWSGALILAAVVLALCELSYAHLGLNVLWPLRLVAMSLWHAAQAPLALLHVVPWLVPVALLVAATLMWLEDTSYRRRDRKGGNS